MSVLAEMAAVVPVVDMDGPRDIAVQAVLDACTTSGFFRIRNHGISKQLVSEHFRQQKLFFDLPMEDKLRIKVNAASRGYVPIGAETLDPAKQTQGDTKEGLLIGREIDQLSDEAKLPLHGSNQWPSEDILPGYKGIVQEYFEECSRLGLRLLQLLALSLDLPEAYFDEQFKSPVATLRPNHYAATASQPEQGVLGCGAHTDFGMLTILWTDGTPGLQIFTGEQWRAVPSVPDTFTINLGDMFEQWTNGKFHSTLHRVVTDGSRCRDSMAFFFDPSFTTVIEPLPHCSSSPDNPAKYSATTSGQYVLDRYQASQTGSKTAISEGS